MLLIFAKCYCNKFLIRLGDVLICYVMNPVLSNRMLDHDDLNFPSKIQMLIIKT